jgi:uncharacterized integral membrane protein (TIGR00698 family)
VATVVAFGTCSMLVYPALYPHLGLSEQAYGIYAGSTIHEVAQVIVAGKNVSDAAAGSAVIEKMLRVMMLAPFLLFLSGMQRSGRSRLPGAVTIPWFALLFVAVSAINSARLIPQAWSGTLIGIDTALLATAMGAIGLRTDLGAVREAGAKPLMLASALFAFLIVGGYGINRLVMALCG